MFAVSCSLRPHSHHHAGHSAAAAAPAASAGKPKLYNPRHPERTLLYQTIAEHFETWPAQASSTARATTTAPSPLFARHSVNIWSTASLPTAVLVPAAMIAATTTLSPSPAKAGVSGQMRIIAFITHSADIRQILDHIGVESEPPQIPPARGPPLWDDGGDAQMDDGVQAEPDWDGAAQAAPDYEVDQRVNW